jgi:hypothetical protein
VAAGSVAQAPVPTGTLVLAALTKLVLKAAWGGGGGAGKRVGRRTVCYLEVWLGLDMLWGQMLPVSQCQPCPPSPQC